MRPDPLDPFVCCRQCFLPWILLPVDIYQQQILAVAIRSTPWQRWFHRASRPEVTCDWTRYCIHGTLLHHQCRVHRAADGSVLGYEQRLWALQESIHLGYHDRLGKCWWPGIKQRLFPGRGAILSNRIRDIIGIAGSDRCRSSGILLRAQEGECQKRRWRA
jgi:hypothetical protein